MLLVRQLSGRSDEAPFITTNNDEDGSRT
jgi:hypothetical protein